MTLIPLLVTIAFLHICLSENDFKVSVHHNSSHEDIENVLKSLKSEGNDSFSNNGLSSWLQLGPCSETCGQGQAKYIRKCNLQKGSHKPVICKGMKY